MTPAGEALAWELTGRTAVVGVIGWPVEHSVSPPMHNAAFRAVGLDWCYVPLPVAPDALAEAVGGLRALGMRGVNVTVPHKRALLGMVDSVSPAARAIGAVNTVVCEGGRFHGHNTDAAGFMRALREAGSVPEGSRALVLGAGGAARAVVYALGGVCSEVTVLNRTPDRARRLVDELSAHAPVARLRAEALGEEALRAASADVDLVVNTTSAGMWPAVTETPWHAGVSFPRGALLYDLVYNPRETALMRRARGAGCRAVDGLRMLVHQGAEAFTLWTGVEAPVEVMYAACVRALGGE